jgi:Fe2+ or Zn2+ uptake regulation protein
MKNVKHKNIQKSLRSAGLRATGQRLLILEIIRQRQGHLDANEILRSALARMPRLNLSTVYRNLQKLKEQGLIEEYHFNENHHHYEMKLVNAHHHLVCLGCDHIIEFSYNLAKYVTENVAEAENFMVTKSEVHMAGYCPDCQKKLKKTGLPGDYTNH